MTMNTQLMILLASTTGAGFLMVLAGMQKSTLEPRRRKRVCPSCGKQIEGRTCQAH
jgi:hypothetical protein